MDDLRTLTYVLLIPLGLVIATYRTLSGFFIVRIVLLLFSHASANAVASISLAMIVLNAERGAGFQLAGIAALCLQGPLRQT